MPAKQTDIRWIAWIICFTSLVGVCIAWGSLHTLDASPILRVVLFAIGGFSMLGLVFFFPDISDRKSIYLILGAAILLRILLLPAPLSDDVNRYLWEGELVLAGENPYAATADDARWESRRDAIWEGINHRDRPTAYPPGIQWIMAANAAIQPTLFSFKILALLGDLAVLLLLLKLLLENSAPIRWLGFYAFNPVSLISFAAEGHFDSLMAAALLAAILSASRGKKSAWLWLGVAIQIKLVCLVLVPLFLSRKSLRSSWLLALVLILPSLPFLTALPGWIDGIHQFSGNSAFNAPLFTLLASAGLGLEIVRALCFGMFLILAAAICIARWRGLPLIDSCLWMLGALLACSPIVHFWYLAWLLPLTALRPSFAWTTASIAIAGYFLAWETQHTHGWWGFGHGIAAVIWLPWLLTGIAQNRFLLTKCLGHPAPVRSPGILPVDNTPAIIIPVLEPSPTLETLIQNLRQELGNKPEIIIATIENPEEKSFPGNTRLITASRGRGNQIAAAIASSESEWILIVHSDTTPLPSLSACIESAIINRPETAMFVFGQRFDKRTPGTAIIEALNEIRVVFGGVAFGDQTMLIRRSALETAGGFPAQPLMEDVEVSMRLTSIGETLYLGREWKVSAQKWEKNLPRRILLIIRLVATYQLARLRGRSHAAVISEKMYREYYPDTQSQR